MDNQIKLAYAKYAQWLATHSHRDRILILIAGWVLIYLLWYVLFQKSIEDTNTQLKQQLVANQKALQDFQNEIADMSKHGQQIMKKRNEEALLRPKEPGKVLLASKKDDDLIIQSILSPGPNVDLIGLTTSMNDAVTNKSRADDTLQVNFSSNYFSTMSYLSQLEKLPWCLSWDSLEYKVGNYPQATVIINLHIVNS